jgi:hypothetical protein
LPQFLGCLPQGVAKLCQKHFRADVDYAVNPINVLLQYLQTRVSFRDLDRILSDRHLQFLDACRNLLTPQ